MAKRSKDSPFGALASLRGKLPAGTEKPAAARVKAETHKTGSDENDAALFRAALGGVTPIADSGHAEIERARPAPLPRPQTDNESEPDTPLRRRPADPNDPEAVFREAMTGVARLADSDRADTGRQPCPARRLDPAAEAAVRTIAPALPDDIDDPSALFRHAVGQTAPLPDDNRIEPSRPQPAPQPRQREEDEAAVLRESIEAPLSFEDRIDTGDEGVHLRDGLPRRILTDLRRGRWVVQAELDLHGLTRDEARSALGHFLHDALENGYRCVRLIHGKGHGSPGREPVLKHLSRGWLMQREEILAFCQARPHDGGEGALLILLRAPGKAEKPSRNQPPAAS